MQGREKPKRIREFRKQLRPNDNTLQAERQYTTRQMKYEGNNKQLCGVCVVLVLVFWFFYAGFWFVVRCCGSFVACFPRTLRVLSRARTAGSM
jgi:hypothetical protein